MKLVFFIRLRDKGAFAGFPQQVTFIYQLGDGLAHRKAAYVVVLMISISVGIVSPVFKVPFSISVLMIFFSW